MANYYIISKGNEILYEGPNQDTAVSNLPEDPSNISPTSILFLTELKNKAGIDYARIHYIKNACRSRIDPSIPSGGDNREIPTKTLERLINGWRKTRSR